MPNPYELGPAAQRQAVSGGLLGAAGAMGQYSPTPNPFMQSLSRGLLGYQQGYTESAKISSALAEQKAARELRERQAAQADVRIDLAKEEAARAARTEKAATEQRLAQQRLATGLRGGMAGPTVEPQYPTTRETAAMGLEAGDPTMMRKMFERDIAAPKAPTVKDVELPGGGKRTVQYEPNTGKWVPIDVGAGGPGEGQLPFKGKGARGSAFNTLIRMKRKERRGEELTDDDKALIAATTHELTAPKVTRLPDGQVVTVEQPPLPGHLQFPGVTPTAAPKDTPRGGMDPSKAGRVAMIITAIDDVDDVIGEVFGADNKIDTVLLTNMWLNTPGTNGAYARAAIERAIETRVRLTTGAVVNKEEMENNLKQFMPRPYDQERLVRKKLSALRRYLSLTRALVGRLPNVPLDYGDISKMSTRQLVDFHDDPRATSMQQEELTGEMAKRAMQ